MNIYIAGGGRVGFHIARLLTQESHDVTVIETNLNRVEQIDYALDCRTVQGSASSALLLQELGVSDADLFVSVTGNDETNLIACATAKKLGAQQAVARVDNPKYIESNILYEEILGIDYILSPDALTANEIARYLESPGIVSTEDFGRGLIRMRQIRVSKSPTTHGKTLRDIEMPEGALVGVIVREGKTFIASGDSTVEPGDVAAFFAERSKMAAVEQLFKGTETRPSRIVIMGGSPVGQHLAAQVEHKIPSVKIFDWDLNHCNLLAAELKKAKVVCRDATSRTALEQEHVDRADVFVACTSDDERNIMASVLAKEVGATESISVVHQPDFASLVRKLGVDHAVTPRASFANRILRLVHQKNLSTLAVIGDGEVEIIELQVRKDAPAIGESLRNLRLPKDTLIVSIVRDDKIIVPRGDDVLQENDSIIVIAYTHALDSVEKLFQR
ncbi:MAG: hypothetical protein AMXMBFR84_12490 [Candidatus Hydrogenedentota bacterium]